MEVIKIFSAFAGYDAMLLALKRLVKSYPDFSFECVGYSEIDKYACIAHDALHPAIKSYGDITAVDWSTVPDFDILTWSSPCQSVSAAGKLKGVTEGTDAASAVIWSIDRCLAVKHPRYILLENVANIVGARFIGEFNRFQDLLRGFGYKCHTKIMNAKQYGVPQNRERLFLVATSEEVDGYHFPEPFPLEKRLKDVLEQDVDERYYLSADRVAGLLKSTLKERGRGNGFVFSPKTEESETANCITTHEGGRKTDNFIAEDAVEVVGNLYDGNPQAGRVYDPEGIAPTLDTCNGGNREPKIITSPHGYNRGNIVDVFPTVKASAYQDNNHVIETKVNIAAIRGRSDGDWHGSEHQQRLEEGGDICGAITSVAKDNMLVERHSVKNDEVWVDIVGYEGFYQISNFGRVKSLCRTILKKGEPYILKEKMMTDKIDKDGYHFIGLSKESDVKWFKIHRLVAQAFLPNPQELPEVNHIDKNTHNNIVSNLEWCNRSYNSTHSSSTPIIQKTLDGDIVNIFPSAAEAARVVIGSEELRTNILHSCKNPGSVSHGYLWEFAKEKEIELLGWTRSSDGKRIEYHKVDIANCVTANKRENTQNYVKEEYELVEKSIIEDFYACREPREYAEVAPTLRSEREGLKVKEQYLLNGDKDGCFSTLTTGHDRARNITEPKGGHKQMGVLEYDGRIVCIRRLTERELFRIMDVDEPDIDILLSAGIPKTQLAKLAGNSIVVNCLYHIFRKMFIDVENESQQTLLF